MSVTPLKVLIVGGGVAGPVMAMVLQKLTKHTVILVDANPEDASPVGAAIGIAPNGLNALKFIGADHVVTDIGGRVECMAVGNGETGELLANESVLDTFTEKFGCTAYGVVRHDLCVRLRALAKQRGIDIRFNTRLESVEQIDDTVTAHFADGESLTADLLIGCDGLHSTVRRYVVENESGPNFAGISVILGLATLDEEQQDQVARGLQMWEGEQTIFGVIPADNKGTVVCFTGFPTKDPAGGETEWNKDDHSAEQLIKLAESKTAGFAALQPKLVLPKLWRVFPLGLYDRQPIGSWHKGRVVLVGDAAHPTTPFGGQGGQMAIESAVILGRLLAENNPSDGLFKRYHTIRHPRTDRVTLSSRRGIQFMMRGGPFFSFVKDWMLYLFAGYFFRSGLMGQYGYDAGTAPLG